MHWILIWIRAAVSGQSCSPPRISLGKNVGGVRRARARGPNPCMRSEGRTLTDDCPEPCDPPRLRRDRLHGRARTRALPCSQPLTNRTSSFSRIAGPRPHFQLRRKQGAGRGTRGKPRFPREYLAPVKMTKRWKTRWKTRTLVLFRTKESGADGTQRNRPHSR